MAQQVTLEGSAAGEGNLSFVSHKGHANFMNPFVPSPRTHVPHTFGHVILLTPRQDQVHQEEQTKEEVYPVVEDATAAVFSN